MVVGVLGEAVVNGVVLELRQEHVHGLYQHMGGLDVRDLQVKIATIDIVLVRKMVLY